MTFERILLSRLKFIGDVVLTTPLIRTIRDRFPKAYLAYLGEEQSVSLLRENPFLDEIIPVRLTNVSITDHLKLFRLLRSRHFDLAIDLFSNPRTALQIFLTGARIRVGGNLRGRRHLYTVQISDDGKSKSAIDFHYQSLQAVGIEPLHYQTEIFLTDNEKSAAQKLLAELGIDTTVPIVGLHPGGTWPAKLWPLDRFVALAEKLQKDVGVNVVLTGGPEDRERVQALVNLGNHRLHSTPQLPLRSLAALIAQCSVYVSNDCGPMHIAVAVGTPTVGIFGPGEEDIWFPYTQAYPGGSSVHSALRKEVPCHPCHLNVCNRTGNDEMACMKLISVDDVYQATIQRLRR